MLFGQDRNQLRQMYFQAWGKARHKQALSPLEEMVVNVITMHPEYHPILEDEHIALHQDYFPELGETNPFLHMGMHIALHEQVSTDRPAGIRDLARQFLQTFKESHAAEHQMIEALAETLWSAQQNNEPPNEQNYLQQLRELLKAP